MGKNVLIAGKDLPLSADFADAFNIADFNVVLASSSDDANSKKPSGVSVVRWNRSSSLSARSVLIQAETEVGFINDYILYFDAPSFAVQFDKFNKESCSEALDFLVSSFQHLTMEILNRIEQRKEKSRLIFVLKANSSIKDVMLSASLKNSVSNPSNPFVAAAEASFATFAETIAASFAEKQFYSVLLVFGDEQNETIKNDSTFASWLASYIEASDSLKSKPSLKVATSWIKAGAKNPGGFSLFR